MHTASIRILALGARLGIVALVAACSATPSAPRSSGPPASHGAPSIAPTGSPTAASASPAPSYPAGTVLALEPLDRDAFVNDAPVDGDGLRARSIAVGPGGWLIGGGQAIGSGPATSHDAAMWFSVDGMSWDRLDDADVFGGEGHQFVTRVAAAASGWWALGESRTGMDEDQGDPRLWRSDDGVHWRGVEASCSAALACAGAKVEVHAFLASPRGDDASESGTFAAGRAGGTLGVFRLDGQGVVQSMTVLPIPGYVDDPATVEARSVTMGPHGWFILGRELVSGEVGLEPRVLGWSSPDGRSWKALGGGRRETLVGLFPRDVVATPHGWISAGQELYLSDDLETWRPVLTLCCGSLFDAVVVHGSLLVALSDDDVRVRTSSDGLTWTAVALTDPMFADDELSSGAQPAVGASDGTQLVFAGSDWPGAAAWLGVTP